MHAELFDPTVVLSDERIKKRVKRIESRRLMKEITNWKLDDSQTGMTPKVTDNSINTFIIF